MTRDLRQFINNGVPILDILAESMGVARGEIMDMASEGKITFDILNRAFRDATGEGGKFEGGMNTLSKTLGGLFSTLKDNINIAEYILSRPHIDEDPISIIKVDQSLDQETLDKLTSNIEIVELTQFKV